LTNKIRVAQDRQGWTLTIPQLLLGDSEKSRAVCVGWILTIPQLPLGGLATTLKILAQEEKFHARLTQGKESNGLLNPRRHYSTKTESVVGGIRHVPVTVGRTNEPGNAVP
jgi:hypothetical protein